MAKINKYLGLICIAAAFFACRQTSKHRPIISVSIDPQKYFVEQLVDSLFEIAVMVPAGVSPESYDPSPIQIKALAQCKAYFSIGPIGFNRLWLDKIKDNNPQLPIFDNSKNISLIVSEKEHGEHGHQHTGGVDPHIWSSPRCTRVIVQNIYEALLSLDAEKKDIYDRNLIKLQAEIDRTDSLLTRLLAQAKTKSFIIYHPALTYLARDYGLTQYCIEIDGKEPSPTDIKQLIETAKNTNTRVVFIQEEFDKKNAEIIAEETGCKLVVINPLSYNWSRELIRIAQTLTL
jgi:zinc transport system substrate-binding protein